MADPVEYDPTTVLAHALRYASLGFRVLPIKPGTKRPPMTAWVEAATRDPAIITNWYSHLYADHGIGLAMGVHQPSDRCLFALDVDEHDPAHSGSETLAELAEQGLYLPDTARSITGSDGMHHLFMGPKGVVIRNGVAGDGLDVRGEGGQIVVEPSVHPVTGREYVWESGFAPWEHGVADAPGWLLELIAPSAPAPASTPAPAPSAPFAQPDSPAEWLRAQWSWSLQLRDAGWVEHHVDRRTGDVHWTRPDKERREGESAVLHMPDGPFVVFSTDPSMAGLHAVGRTNRDGSVSLSPFDFYAAHRHHGDKSAAARAINELMDPSPASRLSGPAGVASPGQPASTAHRKVKLTAASSITVRRVHWLWDERIAVGTLALLAGPEGLGKSTFAYWLAARVTRGELPGENDGREHGVLVCATEDSWEHTIVPRLMAHGADLSRVHRMEVEVDGAPYAELSLPADLLDVEQAAAETSSSLLILDPLMSRLDAKLDSHRDGEVRLALEPLVRTAGRARLACLGLIHHNKSGSTDPLDLVMASKAFTAVARSVHTVLRDPDDETGGTRLFGTTKNNLGRLDLPVRTFTIGSFMYDTFDDDGAFDGQGQVGQLQWGPNSLTSIQAALRNAGDAGDTNAEVWLRDYMRKHGPRVNSRDAYKAADAIPPRSLRRARERLGLDVEEVGGIGRGRQTFWFDPTDARLGSSPDPDSDVPTLGDVL